MESIERKNEEYAVVLTVNLLRATLNEVSEIKDYLEDAISESDKDIVVNLSACDHLDSTFLGALVSYYKRLKTQNRTIVIIEPVEQSSIFITLNSIGKIFPLYTNVQAALDDIKSKKLVEKEIKDLKQEPGVSNDDPETTSSESDNKTRSGHQPDLNAKDYDSRTFMSKSI